MTTYTITYKKSNFSKKELEDILISVVVLSLALFFIIARSGYRLSIASSLGISFLMVLTAFLLHEMSHKFTAIKYGAWSEFRMWPMGLVLTIITGLIGFLFALPGAVYFSTYRNPIREGKIALAGPTTNLIIGTALIPVFFFVAMPASFRIAVQFLIYINIWLGAFNLIPFPPLDGSKVYAWDKRNWAVSFSIAVILVGFFFVFIGI